MQRAHDAVPCGDDDNPPTHSDPTDTSDPTEQTGIVDPTEDNDTGPEVEPLPTLSELAAEGLFDGSRTRNMMQSTSHFG